MADERKEQAIDDALKGVEPAKRAFLKALVIGTAFGAPMVASFSMKGISTYDVLAQGTNGTQGPQ